MIQQNMLSVQESIAEHITNDYATSNRVVSELFTDSAASQERASLQIMDGLIGDNNTADSLAIIDVFLKDRNESYSIYEVRTMKTLKVTGKAMTVPQLILADAKGLDAGELQITPSKFIKRESGVERQNIESYKLKSKPWLVVIKSSNQDLRSVQTEGELVLKSKFDELNQKMETELLVINADNFVTQASDVNMIGAKVLKVSKYEPSSRAIGYNVNEFAGSNFGNFFVYQLKTAGGKELHLIGKPKKTLSQTVVFGSNLELFKKENLPVGNYLGYTVIFNLILSFFVIHLLANNYVYYIEGRKNEEEIRHES